MPDFTNPAHRTTAQRLNRASPFQHNDEMEALATMRDKHPAEFAKIAAIQRIALGLYEGSRDIHARIGGDAA